MEEMSSKDRHQPQIAAHKLQWNIINGVERAAGHPVDIISSVAVSDYPAYPQILFRCSRFSHCQGANDVLLPFINIFLLKHITRLFSTLVLVLTWLWQNKRYAKKRILVYGMHSPHVLAAVVAIRLLGGKAVLIIPDLPAYADVGIRRGVVRRITKPLDICILSRLLQRMSGLVVLTKYMAEDFAPDLPVLVMEGAVSSEATLRTQPSVCNSMMSANPATRIVLYAGTLVKEYGVELLLDAFCLVPDPEYRLWLCGKGPMESRIRECANHDDRIEYWGFLHQDELSLLMQQATILAHPRLSNAEYVRYSFPSKLLEYMKTGRPVLSTALPGIPEEYYDYLYLLKDETPEGLAIALHELCTKPEDELSRFGERGREFVETEKNYMRQGQRIHEFIMAL